jgi:hypothetical protein
VKAIWHHFLNVLNLPFKLLWAALTSVANLTRQQIRSLVTVSFLAGMMSLSAENWVITHTAERAAAGIANGTKVATLFEFLTDRMRFTSALQFWLALILGAVVIGADYMRFKFGDTEATLGKGETP